MATTPRPRATNGAGRLPPVAAEAREVARPPRGDGSLVDAAIDAIRRKITTGELRPGERIPPERVLVHDLGVSRTVVREALSSLEALGLVEGGSTRGRFVAAGNSATRNDAVIAGWLHQHSREIFEMDEIRAVLEAHAIRAMSDWDSITAARTAAELLQRQVQALDRADAVEAAKLDAEFHMVISSATKNSALKALIERLAAQSRPEMLAVYSLPAASQRSLRQHREIVEALVASDVDRAAEVAREHMIDVAREFAFPTASDGDSRPDPAVPAPRAEARLPAADPAA